MNCVLIATQAVYVAVGVLGVVLLIDSYLDYRVMDSRSVVPKVGQAIGIIILALAQTLLLWGLLPPESRDAIRLWGSTMLLIFVVTFRYTERASR